MPDDDIVPVHPSTSAVHQNSDTSSINTGVDQSGPVTTPQAASQSADNMLHMMQAFMSFYQGQTQGTVPVPPLPGATPERPPPRIQVSWHLLEVLCPTRLDLGTATTKSHAVWERAFHTDQPLTIRLVNPAHVTPGHHNRVNLSPH